MVAEAEAPTASKDLVTTMVPLEPTGGVVNVKPGVPVIATKAMSVGIVEETLTFSAAFGPLLVTVKVY